MSVAPALLALSFFAQGVIGTVLSGWVLIYLAARKALLNRQAWHIFLLGNCFFLSAIILQVLFLASQSDGLDIVTLLRYLVAGNFLLLYLSLWQQNSSALPKISLLFSVSGLGLTFVWNYLVLDFQGVSGTRIVALGSDYSTGGEHLFGFTLGLLLIILLNEARARRSSRFWASVLFLLLFGMATGARTFLLAAVLGATVFIKSRRFVMFLALCLPVLVFIILLAGNFRFFAVGSDEVRLAKWSVGIAGFDGVSLLIGYGIVDRTMYWYDNSYLSLLVDGGFVGLLGLLAVAIRQIITLSGDIQKLTAFSIPLVMLFVNDYGYSANAMACACIYAAYFGIKPSLTGTN